MAPIVIGSWKGTRAMPTPLRDANMNDHNFASNGLAGGDHTQSFPEFQDHLAAARPRLQAIARLRGVAPDSRDDVVQDTLIAAWQSRDRLRTRDGLSAWLDEICRNMCRRYARTQMAYQRRTMS